MISFDYFIPEISLDLLLAKTPSKILFNTEMGSQLLLMLFLKWFIAIIMCAYAFFLNYNYYYYYFMFWKILSNHINTNIFNAEKNQSKIRHFIIIVIIIIIIYYT